MKYDLEISDVIRVLALIGNRLDYLSTDTVHDAPWAIAEREALTALAQRLLASPQKP